MRLKTISTVPNDTDLQPPAHRAKRAMSTEEGMKLRLKEREALPRRSSHRPAPSHPNIQRMVESMGEGRQSGLTIMGTVYENEEMEMEKEDSENANNDTVIDVREA